MSQGFCLVAALLLPPCATFVVIPPPYPTTYSSSIFSRAELGRNVAMWGRRRHLEEEEDEAEEENRPPLVGIPQLPPLASSSSLRTQTTEGGESNSLLSDEDEDGPMEQVALVTRKFELSYTCCVCETRNRHWVSRIAYRNGVVITRCQGCQNQHIIADNLGWTNYTGGFEGTVNNIEEYFASKGQNEAVQRVNPHVFQLEELVRMDTTSGSIFMRDGRRAME